MDPFAMLGAPRRYDLDLTVLEKTHRELSRALHPDKFAQAGASERRAALEKAASVNEAWRTLRDPIRRAEALFTLAGFDVGEDKEPKPRADFLMEMMESREELADARVAKDLAKVRSLAKGIEEKSKKAEAKLVDGFSRFTRNGSTGESDLKALLPLLGELRFYRRFLEEVDAIEEEAAE